jgi:hypothetical protein
MVYWEKNYWTLQVTDKLYHIMLYTSQWVGFEITTSVVIGINCIGSYKSNYHMIMAMIATYSYLKMVYISITVTIKQNDKPLWKWISQMVAPNSFAYMEWSRILLSWRLHTVSSFEVDHFLLFQTSDNIEYQYFIEKHDLNNNLVNISSFTCSHWLTCCVTGHMRVKSYEYLMPWKNTV